MLWRAIFLAFVVGSFCMGNSGCGEKPPATPASEITETSTTPGGTRAAQTPEFLPATAYMTMTARPAELLQQPAVRQLYDHLTKAAKADEERERQKSMYFNRNSRWIFPGGEHSGFLDLESYTRHLCSRISHKKDLLTPFEGRVYRYKDAAQFNRALNYAKQDYKPATVPAFTREVLQQEHSVSTLQHEKPFNPVAYKARVEVEEYETPPVKGEPLPPRKPAPPPRRNLEEEEDRQPLPTEEKWKYAATICTEGDRTLLFSYRGQIVAQMLDAKNGPAWAADYAKIAGYPFSAAVNFAQVRDYAKSYVNVRYLSELQPEVQQTLRDLIEQLDLALVAVDTAEGLKLYGRFEAADEDAAKQALTLLEKLRAKAPGLALPFLSEINRLIPGGGALLGRELQAALTDLKLTQKGRVISLNLTIPAAVWEAAVKKSLATLVQMERELQGIRWVSEAMREHVRAKRTYPATTLSKEGQPVSWRVQLLPFLGEQSLYEKYNQDEPWDSETNLKVLAQMPNMYRAPGSDPKSNTTCYVMPVHPKSMCPEIPVKFGFSEQRFYDGTSKTIAILETATEIPWTKPDDLLIDDAQPLPELGFKSQPLARVIMASGDIRAIRKNVTLAELLPWLTPRGGDQLVPLEVE